ncbi:hypothetical protein CYLTODRAFT_425156 [Cylindrobasidium torrendii FP15055 ss-10]|uniref:Uncharacterized protein n=1 Tax=Cylindrobasidium torrendii FP15055 ss-10 TaxID=1314674 RepID=A0A0D7B4P1_9AGAR|nr:hypothetical protein CYLTODRAFT_425156 [Cylindrobasidium torrendii FP15055 ss-10]
MHISELPDAATKRENLAAVFDTEPLLAKHLSLGMAYTVGSAVGEDPPTIELCLEAFQKPNKAGVELTTGARAWSKHAARALAEDGWWGRPSGPVAGINAKALELFYKVMDHATWRNLHWLPHQILVYEARVFEGYGMRWSRDCAKSEGGEQDESPHPWVFRGFVEPMMENGHEIGWRH